MTGLGAIEKPNVNMAVVSGSLYTPTLQFYN